MCTEDANTPVHPSRIFIIVDIGVYRMFKTHWVLFYVPLKPPGGLLNQNRHAFTIFIQGAGLSDGDWSGQVLLGREEPSLGSPGSGIYPPVEQLGLPSAPRLRRAKGSAASTRQETTPTGWPRFVFLFILKQLTQNKPQPPDESHLPCVLFVRAFIF